MSNEQNKADCLMNADYHKRQKQFAIRTMWVTGVLMLMLLIIAFGLLGYSIINSMTWCYPYVAITFFLAGLSGWVCCKSPGEIRKEGANEAAWVAKAKEHEPSGGISAFIGRMVSLIILVRALR